MAGHAIAAFVLVKRAFVLVKSAYSREKVRVCVCVEDEYIYVRALSSACVLLKRRMTIMIENWKR